MVITTRTGYIIFCRIFSSPQLKRTVCCFVVWFFFCFVGFFFKLEVKSYSFWRYLQNKAFWKNFTLQGKVSLSISDLQSELPQATNSHPLQVGLVFVFWFFNTILEAFATGILRTNKYARVLFISGILSFVFVAKTMKKSVPNSSCNLREQREEKENDIDKRCEQIQNAWG